MMKIFRNTNHIHFIGVGGIGMSGMAELLLTHGFTITGSDISESDRTRHLINCGIKVYSKHNSKNIKDCDVIVYSSAVDENNPEILAGKKIDIPIIKRAELLGELIKIKEISIAVSGTHGKTTTSSMLGNILYEYKLNPTLIIGGIVNKFNSNNISGSGNIIVVEADEFDKSFLSLSPTFSIINNLDLEHLDIYKNLNSLQKTFSEFGNAVPFYGKVFINNDCERLAKVNDNINRPKSTFSIYNNSDLKASNISYSRNKTTFSINSKSFGKVKITLNCPGEHNIYNALAATAISLELDIPINNIKIGLEKYMGVKRRFDIKYNNKINGIMVIDDYAHHPSEIAATLKAAKKGWNKRIIAIFQPHLYSRTRDFYKEFANSLSIADSIIISDIYPAREKPIKGISNKIILNQLVKIGHNNIFNVNDINDIPNIVCDLTKKNDMIICMGAGSIFSIPDKIIKKINI